MHQPKSKTPKSKHRTIYEKKKRELVAKQGLIKLLRKDASSPSERDLKKAIVEAENIITNELKRNKSQFLKAKKAKRKGTR